MSELRLARPLGIVLLAASSAAAFGACGDDGALPGESTRSVEAYLNAAERMARYTQIRDAAATRGIDRTGFLLAGIAYAETGLAHCWSEATWACQGPNSADCGNGPVIAGAADGPCSAQQGGLGMFQFDAGTFTDTLNTYGSDVLTVAGNTSHALDYVVNMVKISTYTTNAETNAKALQWVIDFDIGNSTLRDQWVKTVTRYYNGCQPTWSCWTQRYNHYNDSLQTVINETGLPFWVVNTCVAETEVCNGVDDDCDEQVDEGEVCEREALLLGQSWVAPARNSDVDGDGRADVCGRGSAGVWCHLSQGTSWSEMGAVLELSDAQGWNDASNYGTLRMGDVDGDGRADLCARANASVSCWKSDGTAFATHVEGPSWSDASGWADFKYHSTMRLADIDGDGRDDLCARASDGILCHKSNGAGFGDRVDGPDWSDAAGLGEARYYGTLRVGDIDADGRDDLCMRTQEGMECFLSDEAGFPTRVAGPGWSDASGWGGFPYWSTIRLADVNGDGRADLCARAAAGLRCHLSEGQSFGDAIEVAALSDASGWNDPSNFLTLRTGDLDGDGAQDLCIRANARVHCYLWDGDGFAPIDGPAWSDADAWNEPRYFHSIQMGDMNGDGKADLCGRHVDGWRCHPSTGTGFGDAISLDEFTDAGGWDASKYFATILFGTPGCVPVAETCNGADDDCDGEVDEDGVCVSGTGGSGGMIGAAGMGGAGSGGAPAGSSGAAGAPAKGDEFWRESPEEEGCGCRTAPGNAGARSTWLVALILAMFLRKRRQACR